MAALELYMHGGVSFTPYKEQFKKLIGKDIHYLEMYNASEGFFAAQDHPGEDGMLLFPGSWHFYGIHAGEEYGKERSPNHRAGGCGNRQELCTGDQHQWRPLEILHRVIRFSLLLSKPFRIKVSGRIETLYQCIWRRSDR